MNQPPGPPDPQDPWAAPTGDQGPAPEQPGAPEQPPGYGQPGYPRNNAKAVAALWTGVGAIVLSLCCGVGILAAPVAIVLGVRARTEIRARGEQGSGMATAGIVTGAIAIVLSIALVALIVLAFASGDTSYNLNQTRV
jgi:hypothetical protein